MRILVVDHDKHFLDSIDTYLQIAKYKTSQLTQGKDVMSALEKQSIDLLILDSSLHDVDSLALCKKISTDMLIPIIMMVSENSEDKIVSALEAGADDVLVKPIRPREFIAHIEALLRRVKSFVNAKTISLNDGQLTINIETREVSVEGKLIDLTLTEFDILYMLVANRPNVFSRAQLVERIKGLEYKGLERIVDTHVKNLRKKIEIQPSKPEYVVTVHGVGYKCGVQ